MSKKIITTISDSEYNEQTGSFEVKRTHQVAVLGSEDKFYKFYYEGLIYISDMPAECHKVFYALLENMTYVDQKVEGLDNYGMHIFLNADVKRGIAKSLGYENPRSLDNVIQKLLKGDVLLRIGTGIYRPNPFIVARGSWKEIAHLREEHGVPIMLGDTFRSICAKKTQMRKRVAETKAEHTKPLDNETN